MHAYKTSPEFYHPTEKTFQIFNLDIHDANNSLKRKIIDCILYIVERQGKDDKSKEEMLQLLNGDPYHKIIRKINKVNHSVGSLSDEG